ncbi:MAG: ABC transporter permease, partial [Cyclobacteriaceae bacterium]|nr:ABC transporter permease [Cyclobacteriaceae bacterium]
MFKFNLIIAFRNLLKNKEYTLINLLGLSVGIMSFLFILLWINDELSYDRFHEKSSRIYRIDWHSDNPQTRTPHPMTYTMVNDFAEVEDAVSLTPVWGAGLTQPDRLVKNGEIRFMENRIFAADTTFFRIFSFPLKSGNPKNCLTDVGSIVITESIAQKYFGDEDPMGKMITINFGFDVPFRITGIMKEIPDNSHFHFDFLLGYNTLKAVNTGDFFEWSDFGHYNYLLLGENADPRELERKMIGWAIPYLDWPETNLNQLKEGIIGFKLTPLEKIHLDSHIKWELETNGDIAYVYTFSALGIFILLIAIINYMNLSTARTAFRKVEIGVKKVLGASRKRLQAQFLLESVISTLGATLLAIILFEIFSVPLGNIAQKNFELDYANPVTIILLLAVATGCGVLAGLYPAFILSGFQANSILKGGGSVKRNRPVFRNLLVVFQFAISIFLIIGTLTISKQIDFFQTKKLGFNSDQVIVVAIQDTLVLQNYESVKADLLTDHRIRKISAVSNIPGRRFNQNPIQWVSSEDSYPCSEIRVDHDFVQSLDLKIISGRDFSVDRIHDVENVFIINEAAAKLYDWDDPVEEELIWYDDEMTRKGKIIGVVEDFHFQSLHTTIEPLILYVDPDDLNYFLIRLDASGIQETISYLEEKFTALDPENPFSYFFLDDDFSKLYVAEKRMQKVSGYFTVLAIIISCIGLFGLSAYSAERRTKEIGIRKVNGASSLGIIRMLSFEYIRWIMVAFVVAAPVGYI